MAGEGTTARDVGAVYAQGRERLTALLAGISPVEAGVAVPACPEWDVHDALAHVSGVCADILAGRVEGAGTDPWVAVQVEARRDRDVAALLEEWNEAAPQVEAIAAGFGPAGTQWVFDFATHEQDIRGALGATGGRDADSWVMGLEFAIPGFHGSVAMHDLPPVRVIAGGREWGTPPAEPIGTLEADPFELGRALTGRRSVDQIRAFEWSIDPEPYLPCFTFGPFTRRPTDLVE